MKPCGCIGMIGICPAITQSGTIARARKITVEAPNVVHYVTALCACRSRSHESPGHDGQGNHHFTHSQSAPFGFYLFHQCLREAAIAIPAKPRMVPAMT